MNGKQVLELLRTLGLPEGKYVAMGGAALAVHEIRETEDLDILVVPELFDALSGDWPEDPEYFRRWGRRRLRRGQVEIYPDLWFVRTARFENVPELIANADMVHGAPFQPLDHLLMCKRDLSREKDAADARLIERHLASKITA